jgi:hypothetical protein
MVVMWKGAGFQEQEVRCVVNMSADIKRITL